MPLFRRGKPTEPVPGWCSWFTPDEWTHFRTTAEAVLRDRGTPGSVSSAGNVRINDAAGNPLGVSLVSTACDVRHVKKREWATLIAEDLELEAHAVVQRIELFSAGLERVRPLLLPQITLEAGTSQAYEPTVRRHLGGGVVATLGVRSSRGQWDVLLDEVRRWDADPDELWAIALHNLRRLEYHVAASNNRLFYITGDHYAASQLLRLDELLNAPAPNGVIVAVPSTQAWIFCPFTDFNAVVLLQKLPPWIADLYGKYNPLSDGLFWWRSDDHLEEITLLDRDDNVTLQGSEAFCDMVKRVMDEASK